VLCCAALLGTNLIAANKALLTSQPHQQVLPEGAPGVKKGGETRTQSWCCGGAYARVYMCAVLIDWGSAW